MKKWYEAAIRYTHIALVLLVMLSVFTGGCMVLHDPEQGRHGQHTHKSQPQKHPASPPPVTHKPSSPAHGTKPTPSKPSVTRPTPAQPQAPRPAPEKPQVTRPTPAQPQTPRPQSPVTRPTPAQPSVTRPTPGATRPDTKPTMTRPADKPVNPRGVGRDGTKSGTPSGSTSQKPGRGDDKPTGKGPYIEEGSSSSPSGGLGRLENRR